MSSQHAMSSQQLSVQQVRDLAPDARSLAAAQRLARSGAWSEVGGAGGLLWGRCQGSDAAPYQVTVEVPGPVVRCTCPSRKQPCKHGLALLLRQALASPPDVAPSAAVAAPAGPSSPAADPQAQARRLQKRLRLMDDGMAELDRWLVDLVGDGLAAVRQRPYAWWDAMAGRLVDAQVPALAERVRQMPGRIAGRDDWASVLLAEIARWHLAVRAWQGRTALDPADEGELRTYLGWSRSAAEVLAGRRVIGRWTVVGVHRAEVGRLSEQRTWVWHDDVGIAVILDFAATVTALAAPHLVGAVLDGDAALYAGRPPLRVRFAAQPVATDQTGRLPRAAEGWDAAMAEVTAVAAVAPWKDRFPATVADLRLAGGEDDVPLLVDVHGHAVRAVDVDRWRALAITGGRPTTMFGEVVDEGFRPLSAAAEGGVVPLPGSGWLSGGEAT